jgi:hypothetical protein
MHIQTPILWEHNTGPSKNVATPKTCEYIILHGKWDFVDGTKGAEKRRLLCIPCVNSVSPQMPFMEKREVSE